MAEDFTAKFKVDISDLKKNISEANKEIKLANATFKSETAGMDMWSKNADGLGAKLKQLDSILNGQKSVLSAYQSQLQRQQEAYTENGKKAEELKAKLADLANNGVKKTDEEYKKYSSALKSVITEQISNEKACEELKVKILEQKGAVGQTEAAIRHYTESQKNLEKEATSLNSKIKQQSQDLEKLKAEYTEVAAAEGKDSENAKKLGSEIEKLSGELSKNQKSMSDAQKEADKLDKSLDDSGKTAKESSDGFTVMKGALASLVADGIRLAVTELKNLANAAVDSWKEFDNGRDTVIRLTGATGESAQELKRIYTNVSNTIVADSETIGKAVGEVSTRFGLNGTELENLSTLYLKFSEITGSDVINSIDQTQKALASYGLSVDNAAGFLDMLAKTSQTTGVNTSSLTSGIISNATAFQEMGLNIDQAVSFMGMLEKSGTNSETVLNGMRKALKNSAKDGKNLSDSLIELQKNIEGNGDGVKGLQAAYDLFGKSGDQIYGAIKNGTLSFEDLTKAAENAAGTVTSTFDETKDASDGFKLALQRLKTQAADTIDNFIQNNGPQIEKLIKNISENILPSLVKSLGGVVNMIAAIASSKAAIIAIAGALRGLIAALAIGSVIAFANSIQNVILAMKGLEAVTKSETAAQIAEAIAARAAAAAQWLWNAAMNANPIGLLVTAIVALTAGIAALTFAMQNNSPEAKAMIEKTAKMREESEQLSTSLNNAADSVRNLGSSAADNLIDLEAEADASRKLTDELFSLQSQADLTNAQKERMQQIVETLNKSYDGLNLAIDTETGRLNKSQEEIQKTIDKKYELAKANAMQELYTEQLKAVYKAEAEAATVAEKRQAAIDELNNVLASGQKALGGYNVYTKSQIDAMKELEKTINNYDEALANSQTTVKDSYKNTENLSKLYGEEVPDSLRVAENETDKFFMKMNNEVKLANKSMEGSGQDFIAGWVKGVVSKKKAAIDAAREIVKATKEVFTSGFDIHSPSKWSQKIGEYIDTGLVIGIEKNKDKVTKSFNSLVTDSRTEVQKVLDSMNTAILASEKKYNDESERLKDSKSEADKKYLEDLKKVAEEERKIYDAELKDAETAKKNIVDVFNQMSTEVFGEIDELQKLQDDFQKRLEKSTYLLQKVSFGDDSKDWYRVANLKEQTQSLEDFYDLLMKVKNRGNVPKEFFDLLRNMSVEEATRTSNALLSLSDSEFNEFFNDWQHQREVEAQIAQDIYADEAKTLADKVNEKFDEIATNFLTIGENSADEFEAGFTEKLKGVLTRIRSQISEALGGLSSSGITGMITGEMLRNGQAAALGAVGYGGVSQTTENVTNYTQNIYAPQQPSRIELYRQTKNLLELQKRGI